VIGLKEISIAERNAGDGNPGNTSRETSRGVRITLLHIRSRRGLIERCDLARACAGRAAYLSTQDHRGGVAVRRAVFAGKGIAEDYGVHLSGISHPEAKRTCVDDVATTLLISQRLRTRGRQIGPKKSQQKSSHQRFASRNPAEILSLARDRQRLARGF